MCCGRCGRRGADRDTRGRVCSPETRSRSRNLTRECTRPRVQRDAPRGRGRTIDQIFPIAGVNPHFLHFSFFGNGSRGRCHQHNHAFSRLSRDGACEKIGKIRAPLHRGGSAGRQSGSGQGMVARWFSAPFGKLKFAPDI